MELGATAVSNEKSQKVFGRPVTPSDVFISDCRAVNENEIKLTVRVIVGQHPGLD